MRHRNKTTITQDACGCVFENGVLIKVCSPCRRRARQIEKRPAMLGSPDKFLQVLGKFAEAVGEATVNDGQKHRRAAARARKFARQLYIDAGYSIDPHAREQLAEMFGRSADRISRVKTGAAVSSLLKS